jgi:hypothetical protein
MDIKPKKDLTVILDEKKDELKVSKVVKYEGSVFATRKNEYLNNRKSTTDLWMCLQIKSKNQKKYSYDFHLMHRIKSRQASITRSGMLMICTRSNQVLISI